MRTILHVPVDDQFKFEHFVMKCLWPVHPFPDLMPTEKKIKNKFIRDTHDTNAFTIDGNKWTWVTNGGNAIKLDDIVDEHDRRVIMIELRTDRKTAQRRDNGVGVILYHLEKLTGTKRTKWTVKHIDSRIDLDWFRVQNSKHVRDTRPSRDPKDPFSNVILREIIERRIIEANRETKPLTTDTIEHMLTPDYGIYRVELSQQHIRNTLTSMKVACLVGKNGYSSMNKTDIMRFFGQFFDKSDMKYVYNLLIRKYHVLEE